MEISLFAIVIYFMLLGLIIFIFQRTYKKNKVKNEVNVHKDYFVPIKGLNTVLPPNVEPYKRTKVFTASTIPSGLLKEHSTRKGVYGKICVVKGSLEYEEIASEPHSQVGGIYIIRAGECAITKPQAPHQVKSLHDEMEFFVQFNKEKKDL